MNANRWGLVATVLALIGLGFAAMSTNPPFNIPSWVPAAFFVAAVLVLLWLIILLLKKGSKKVDSPKIKTIPDLKIGVKVNKIETYDYSPAFGGVGGGGKAGDKKLTLDVMFEPSKPMLIYKVNLRFWGKDLGAKMEDFATGSFDDWKQITILASKTYSPFFNIPEAEAIDVKDAKIYVISETEKPIDSNLFEVNFGTAK